MKNNTLLLFASLIFSSISFLSFGQCALNATATTGVFLDGITVGNSGIAVGYNPSSDLYYTVEGGNTAMTIVTFNGSGTEVATGPNSGFDFRGVWWNSNNNQLECNGYSNTGIRVNDIDGSQYALSTGTIALTGAQPDAQSSGDYDWDANEIIYYFNGAIYRYDRNTNASLGSYLINGLPVATSNLATTMVGYTGCAGQEIVVFDMVLQLAYLIDKSTGNYVATSAMPATAVSSTNWYDYSYANGQIFIRSGIDWYGYYIFEQCQALVTTVSSIDMCDGELVTLSATSSGTGVVTWDNGVVDSVAFASPIGTTTYTATSTDVNECVFSVDITVNASPTVDAGLDITMCSGIIDTTLIATGVADTFTWDNGIMDGVQFTPSIGITTYVVTAEYTASGCQATDTVMLTAGNPSISLSGSDEMFGNDGSAALTILDGIPPFTFDWDNDGTGDNDDNNDLYGVAGGTYTVIMTDATGCTTTETIIIGSQLGVDELNIDLSVYPNPTSGIVTLSLNGLFEYNVFNTLGQDVLTGSSTDEVQVDLSSFENGTYSIKIITEQQTAVVKIVKQ